MSGLRERVGRWLCARGNHATLEWRRASKGDKARIASQGAANEMLAASGFVGLAAWNGWCPRCGNAVEWSDSKPRPPLPTGGETNAR